MGINVSDAFPSKYLSASDLRGQSARVFVDHAEWGLMGDGKKKIILHFQGKQKGLALNKTNANAIAAAYGTDTDAWRGAELELFTIVTDFQGKMVNAIRVRIPPRQSQPASPQQRAPAPPPMVQAPAGGGRTALASDAQPKDFDDDIPF